jgi:protein-S-isoprenylcysteine O-methyltransferase Ste14
MVFWHFPASIFITLFPMAAFIYRAIVEEKMLLEEFGREYEEYRKRTRMFI